MADPRPLPADLLPPNEARLHLWRGPIAATASDGTPGQVWVRGKVEVFAEVTPTGGVHLRVARRGGQPTDADLAHVRRAFPVLGG